ncbi:response regulator [Spirosoma aerophilum]
MDASFERINKLFRTYIKQVNRVYKLPYSVESQLTSMVGRQLDDVWVVDDDPNDQMFIKVAFKSICPDMPISTFNDGESLLSRIAQTQDYPKLLLLDLNMPRVNGFDALHTLRRNKNFDALGIVILTTSTGTSDEECVKALSLGANQFYTKPSSYKDLVSLVRTLKTSWCDK